MTTQVMGIVDVSLGSAGGRLPTDPAGAIAFGRTLIADGADAIEVSGPGDSGRVEEPADTERIVAVVRALAEEVPVFVASTSHAVAEAAVAVGASAVRDRSNGLAGLAARLGVGCVITARPEPAASDRDAETAFNHTVAELVDAARQAAGAGVTSVWIDPGFGPDSDSGCWLTLLANIGELVSTGYPVLVSASRTPFLGLGSETSVAVAAWAMSEGVAMVSAHDVAGAVAARSVVTGEPVAVARS